MFDFDTLSEESISGPSPGGDIGTDLIPHLPPREGEIALSEGTMAMDLAAETQAVAQANHQAAQAAQAAAAALANHAPIQNAPAPEVVAPPLATFPVAPNPQATPPIGQPTQTPTTVADLYAKWALENPGDLVPVTIDMNAIPPAGWDILTRCWGYPGRQIDEDRGVCSLPPQRPPRSNGHGIRDRSYAASSHIKTQARGHEWLFCIGVLLCRHGPYVLRHCGERISSGTWPLRRPSIFSRCAISPILDHQSVAFCHTSAKSRPTHHPLRQPGPIACNTNHEISGDDHSTTG